MSESQVGEEYHEADFRAWHDYFTHEHRAAIELINVPSWRREKSHRLHPSLKDY